MINFEKDDFDGTLDDIMNSINDLLNGTGEGFETDEILEESEMLKRRKEINKKEV